MNHLASVLGVCLLHAAGMLVHGWAAEMDHVGVLPDDVIAKEGILLRLDQVDMTKVIDLYSRITDRVVIPSPDMTGKVTIINRGRVSPDQAIRLIESAMELQDWTFIPEGGVIKVVRSRDAVKRMVPLVSPTSDLELKGVNRIQTHLVPLKYSSGEDVRSLISPLLSDNGSIQFNKRTNLLVVTEVGTNMARLLDLIERVDRPLTTKESFVDSVTLEHVGPTKMISDITDHFKDTDLSFLPNDRLQILVVTGKRVDVERAVKVIGEFDRPVDPDQIQNLIIQIHYAKAEEVAALIQQVYSSRAEKPPPSFTVNADKASNALVVTGPTELRTDVANLVATIDQRYKQVLLKVLVGEVDANPTRSLGIQWQWLGRMSEVTQDFGGIGNSDGRAAVRDGTAGIRWGVIHPYGYSVFLNALEQSTGFHLLASPQISVASNKQAMFKVTDKVPVQTSERFSDNSNTVVRSQEFQEVGLTLQVTPVITPNREVSIDLDFTFSEITGRDPVFNNPTFASRQTKTNVIVADAHTLILAGLMRRDHDRTENRVPWFGRLPVLGPIFRTRTDTNKEQEIIILLTPDIMESGAEADAISSSYQVRASRGGTRAKHRKSFGDVQDFFENVSESSVPEKAFPIRVRPVHTGKTVASPPSERLDTGHGAPPVADTEPRSNQDRIRTLIEMRRKNSRQ